MRHKLIAQTEIKISRHLQQEIKAKQKRQAKLQYYQENKYKKVALYLYLGQII